MSLIEAAAPLDSLDYIKDLKLNSAEITMYLDTLVWGVPDQVYFMSCVYRSGGQQAADQMWETLKLGRGVSGRTLREYKRGGHYDSYTRSWNDGASTIQAIYQDVRLEPGGKPEDKYLVTLTKIKDYKTFEFTLMHRDCLLQRPDDTDDKRHRFIMLMRPESTVEERLNYFYDHLNTRIRTVPVLRIWKRYLWDELEKHGKIIKLNSHGRFLAWEVQISEDVIATALSRDLAYGRLPLPFNADEDKLAA